MKNQDMVLTILSLSEASLRFGENCEVQKSYIVFGRKPGWVWTPRTIDTNCKWYAQQQPKCAYAEKVIAKKARKGTPYYWYRVLRLLAKSEQLIK